MTQPDNTELIAKAREQAGHLREAAEWRRAMRAVEIADPADAERLAELYDRLATALEAAAKDTERLEELERLAREHGYVKVCHGGEVSDGFWLSRGEYWGICPSLGEAIDASRASVTVPDETGEDGNDAA